ncbi:Na+/H+ antiporter NhaA [Tropicimonas marinistellae]|uniref:Na+/H+ antiporter NhaA n=1 Tax=Tropicimonas marinistellae TaxID=1739787 RepID=UPI00082A5176|nr:Na+/H+ antiporter NhaA [Tropicimonas marinistellae]
MPKIWNFIEEYSVLLIGGAVIALMWANNAPHTYHAMVDWELFHGGPVGHLHDDGHGHVTRSFTLHFLVNDVLMAFFFAVAGKEVWEAIALKNGSLRGKKALTPLIATAGGMIGPVTIYLLGAAVLGKFTLLANGWAIPTATDIAFSYLVGRLIFGSGHPAVGFLLLLAIADDAAGLIILAIFYPQGDLAPAWLLLSVASAVGVYLLFNRLPRMLDTGKQDRPNSTFVRKYLSFWPYLIAGAISWFAFHRAGIHPALGLLPIIPAIPHAEVDYGIFAEEEAHQHDLLNHSEHLLKKPVEAILFGFGLMNAGVEFSAMGAATTLVLAGLLIGKPLGIWAMGTFAARTLGLGLPEGMKNADLFVLGCVAAIGFTVSLFVASVAFPAGAVQDAAKMGALLSFGAAAMSFLAGWIFDAKGTRIGRAGPEPAPVIGAAE